MINQKPTKTMKNKTHHRFAKVNPALTFPDATIIPLHYEGWKHYTQNEKDVERSYQVIGIEQRLTTLAPGIATAFNA